MTMAEIGTSIPPDTPHAVSASLPTWESNVAYELGEDWVLKRMKSGYPRFFVHPIITELTNVLMDAFGGSASETAYLYPSRAAAEASRAFIQRQASLAGDQAAISAAHNVRIVDLKEAVGSALRGIGLFMVILDKSLGAHAKAFWQHTGEGISSRRAEAFLTAYRNAVEERKASVENIVKPFKNRRHYMNKTALRSLHNDEASNTAVSEAAQKSDELDALSREQSLYLEERYGRNLSMSLEGLARVAVRRRIAGTLRDEVNTLTDALLTEPSPDGGNARNIAGLTESDVYLYPCGMNAIYHAHQLALHMRPGLKSVCFGFSYTDTLKILQKFGPGAHFFGTGLDNEIDDLEALLAGGERIAALFCEVPSNPLLRTCNIARLRELADRYGFLIVVDETIGNLINVDVLSYADIVVSSLTKIFSGDSNVMGGSLVLNPRRQFYAEIKRNLAELHDEDNYWGEDVLTLERNSRNFASRIVKINENAEMIAELLNEHPKVLRVHYPKFGATANNYEAIKKKDGGYGGLLSVVLKDPADAVRAYDKLRTCKGPSLGTNFTLVSPYTILAHFNELDWAESYGVDRNLIRISVGLESRDELRALFNEAFG